MVGCRAMLQKVLMLLKGRNSRVLAKNFSALAILQVLRYFIPLIVLPYVTPIIGLEHFGEIAIASSFTLIVQVFVNYSFGFMGARDIARNKDNPEKCSEIVSMTVFSYVMIYLLMILVAIPIILAVPKFRGIWAVIAVSLTWPIFSALVCEWFFQGVEQMQNITIVNFISRVVFVLLIFLFIKNEEHYLLYPLFNALGFVMASAYSLVVITNKYGCRIRIPSIKSVLNYIGQGKDVFVNQLCGTVLNKMPNLLLGSLVGSSSAGLYDAAFRMQDAGYHGVSTLNRTFFPFLARRMDKHNTFRIINLVFSVSIALTLFVFAPQLIGLLYAPDFKPSIFLLRILSFSVLFLGISSAYGVNHLLLIGKEKLVRNISFGVTGSGLLLLVFMVYRYHEIGASLSMVIINAILALSYYIASRCVKDSSTIQYKSIEDGSKE